MAMGRAFSPPFIPMPNSYGDAIGWYDSGPVALEQTAPLALSEENATGGA